MGIPQHLDFIHGRSPSSYTDSTYLLEESAVRIDINEDNFVSDSSEWGSESGDLGSDYGHNVSDSNDDEGSEDPDEEEQLSGPEPASVLASILQTALCPPSETSAPSEDLILESRALLATSPSLVMKN